MIDPWRTARDLLGPAWLLPVVLLWMLMMIIVPLAARRGPASRPAAISLGVLAQVALVGAVLLGTWSAAKALRALVLVPVLGWTAEWIGSRTGVPFGDYHYTNALQPQIRRVPVVIPLAWLMMLPPAWAVAEVLVPAGPWWLYATVAAAGFTAWDIYLDPHLVSWKFWEWSVPGRTYMGIPLSNFLGWFVWAWIITALVHPGSLRGTPLLLVYVLTWLFQFGGHLAFWGLWKSGVVGFFAMGSLALPALWMLFA